jgi:hypothetical protein
LPDTQADPSQNQKSRFYQRLFMIIQYEVLCYHSSISKPNRLAHKRSLTSVYRQIGIDKSEWNVFVVDDNENESEFSEIKKRIELLRKELQLNETDFPTTVLKNTRTRFMSGTGAWNTGIFEVYRQFPKWLCKHFRR